MMKWFPHTRETVVRGGTETWRHSAHALGSELMSSDRAHNTTPRLWKPHPDDADDVRQAMACADRGEFLSAEATEAFLRWMAGVDDESWRAELE